MSIIDTTCSASELILKAVIICDDFAFAAKVGATLRGAASRTGADVQWAIKCWPANALLDRALAEKALRETLDAHLIVLPAPHAKSLPAGLIGWLNRWADLREIQDAALGVIADENTGAFTQPVCHELSRLIRRQGLNLIIDEPPATKDIAKRFVRFFPEPAAMLPIERSRLALLAMRDSYRAVGIND